MLPCETKREIVLVGRAVVGPRLVVMDRMVVIVPVGAVCRVAGVAPDLRDRGAVDRREHDTRLAHVGAQVLAGAQAEAIGQLHARGLHAGLLQQRLQVGRVAALG